MLVRLRARGSEEPALSHQDSPEHAARLAAGVPPEMLVTIVADRDVALHSLAERGFTGPDLLKKALAAEPGTLFILDAKTRAFL